MKHIPQNGAIARSRTVLNIFRFLFLFFPCFVSAQIIVGGNYYSLVLCNDGTVRGWGSNVSGQLGDSTFADKNVPVLVKRLLGVIAIAGEGNHSIALKNDSTVWGWGLNFYGQVGDSSNVNRNIPVRVAGLTGVIAIAAGENHSLALKKDSTVWAWGWDMYGQLGNGTGTSNSPVKVNALSGVIAIQAGSHHCLALKKDGTVYAWGLNASGELGVVHTTQSEVPVQVSGLSDVKSIAGTAHNSYALKNNGTLWAWGSNTYNQLGNNTDALSTIPLQVNGISSVKVITGGFQHSLVLKNDGTVWAWGNNSAGQLGNGAIDSNNIYVYQPTQVQGLSGVVALTGGGTHTLAVKNDGTVWAWGYNLQGQLGNGTNTEFYTLPVKVTGTWKALTSVVEHNTLPAGFVLAQNFPNPFNPTTTIEYHIPNQSHITLKIFDLLGREVATLVNEKKDAGKYSLQWNAQQLTSGVYFYKIEGGNFTQTRKLLLLK